MASWDDDDYVPELPKPVAAADAVPAAGAAAADEDEDATLKELRSEAAAAPAAPAVPQSKARDKHVEKARSRELRGADGAGAGASSSSSSSVAGPSLCANCQADLTPLGDPAAEKKRLEALVIKSEIAAAQALLGPAGAKAGAGGGGAVDMATQVAGVSLLSGDAFRDFGKLAAQRVHEASGSKGGGALAMRFYNEVLVAGANQLGAHELAALGKVLDTARNRKLQEEREKAKGSSAKGKPRAAKVQVGGERHGVPEDYDDYDGEEYAPAGAAASAAAPAGAGGNNTNVDLSLSAAGLKASGAAAAAPGFTRSTFQAEADFM